MTRSIGQAGAAMTIPFTESKFYKRHKVRKEQDMSETYEKFVIGKDVSEAFKKAAEPLSYTSAEKAILSAKQWEDYKPYRVTAEEIPETEPEPAPEAEWPWWVCEWRATSGVSVGIAAYHGRSSKIYRSNGEIDYAYCRFQHPTKPTDDEVVRVIEREWGVTLPVDKWRWQHWNGYSWEEALSPGVGYREYDGSLTIWTDDASRDALRHTFTALARKAGKPEAQP